MSVVARKRADETVYYAVFSWRGERVWERVGTDRREAERLEQRRRREVLHGTYLPPSSRKVTTFRSFANYWLDLRTNRTASADRQRVTDYVLSHAWLADMPIADVRPHHMIRLIGELKATIGKAGRKLGAKSISNTYGAIRTMMRDARIKELTSADPCAIPPGTVPRRRGRPRQPYTAAEVAALLSPAVAPERRMFAALLLFTGMREGEACARRWRDWDAQVGPLGSLTVDSQYEDQPLKTDDEDALHPRLVPVHPLLQATLAAWATRGFAETYGRAPTADDRIVPNGPELRAHTRASGYKAWRRACVEAGVTNRSLHSTRHTFITFCRRGGARKDVLERVTHNARGDIVDGYTHWDWAPLCEAVSCFLAAADVDARVDRLPKVPIDSHTTLGSIPSASTERQRNSHESSAAHGVDRASNPLAFVPGDAKCAARQLHGARVDENACAVVRGALAGPLTSEEWDAIARAEAAS